MTASAGAIASRSYRPRGPRRTPAQSHTCTAAAPAVGRACLNRKKADNVVQPESNVIQSGIRLENYTGRALAASLVGTILMLVMDSGCTFHCHPHQTDLINFRPRRERMIGISGVSCDVTGIGDLPVIARDHMGRLIRLIIRDVRCVPTFTETLLSVDQFYEKSGVEVRFAGHNHVHLPANKTCDESFFKFTREAGLFQWRVLGAARLQAPTDAIKASRALAAQPSTTPKSIPDEVTHASKVEQVHGAKSTSHLAALSADAAVDAMHRRLHVSQELIRNLPTLTADAPNNLEKGRIHSCASCTEANATRLPHKGERYEPSYVGRLVHADIVGPFKRSSVGGYQYMLVIVDDHSRFISVHFLGRKSDALGEVKKFVAAVNHVSNVGRAQPTQIVGTLHTDNAGEFLSREFGEFLEESVIHHTTCPPHVHSLNGVAERAIRAVVENMRSCIVAGNIPISFWNYVATHSADVLNRTRAHARHGSQSLVHLADRVPSLPDQATSVNLKNLHRSTCLGRR